MKDRELYNSFTIRDMEFEVISMTITNIIHPNSVIIEDGKIYWLEEISDSIKGIDNYIFKTKLKLNDNTK